MKYIHILGVEVKEKEKYSEDEALCTSILDFYGVCGIILGFGG